MKIRSLSLFMGFSLIICAIICVYDSGYAEEVLLKNGDRITGSIAEESEDHVVIDTEAMGRIKIRKSFIKSPEKKEVEKSPEVIWERKISAGYNRSSGNTDTGQLKASFFINRNKKHVNEVTLKGDVYYSSSDKKMDAQKWQGSSRYAFSLGEDKKWYNFYKLGADHDRFANIDYRLLPSLGLGYWFYDTDSMKALFEVGGGYEYTNYRDATQDSEEILLIPRGFLEKTLFGDAKIKQDVFFYPATNDFGDYRIHSETVFTNPFTDKLSLDLSLIDDYDSMPTEGTKKNDLRLITSLTYSF